MSLVLGALNLMLGIGLLTLSPRDPGDARLVEVLGCVSLFVGITCLVVLALT